MYKKLIIIIIVMFLFMIFLQAVSSNDYCKTKLKSSIFQEINQTVNKVLIKDEIIGNRHVKYWEHYMNDIFVKNNSILLHTDLISNDIILFEKIWTDVEFDLSMKEHGNIDPDNYYWKKKVVFPSQKDCTHFYTFFNTSEFPLTCWEVRHTDGTTILYNFDGTPIGMGIPTPFEQGFSISNDCEHGYGDCWRNWRENANKWFERWCESTINIGLPTHENISENIQNQNVTFFFELGRFMEN